jgi:Tol biopolymer transport system component
MSKKLHVLILLLTFFSLHGLSQFYVGSNQEFGKNRVQYRDFFWQYYPAERFEVYYYQGGKDLAEYTVRSVQANLAQLEDRFDFQLTEKLQIVLYNKQSEFRQSNIGITGDDVYNIGGAARIVGSKLFLYFEGDYLQFESMLRENLSRVIFSQMMYGGDWKQVIKNNTLLSIPKWYEDGLLSYVANPLDPEIMARINDGITHKKYRRFNRLEGEDARAGGHAMWKYIADVYGENVIPNILYMTRISKNIESGFLYVLGVSLSTLSDEFQIYYEQQVNQYSHGKENPAFKPLMKDAALSEKVAQMSVADQAKWKEENWKRRMGQLPIKAKRKYEYSQFKASPDGRYVAFATHEQGQYKVWLHDKTTRKTKRIAKKDHRLDRIQDNTYPMLTWHPTSKILTYVFEAKGRVFLANYNLEEKKNLERELFRIDKVVDLAYSADGRKMVFSGVKEGRSDLYLFPIVGNTPEQITFDIYDDLYPRFLSDGNTIIFSSNRPDDTLRANVPNAPFDRNLDVYLLHLNGRKLERVTNTPDANEIYPFEYDAKHYTFVKQTNDKRNRYIASIDSTIARIDTSVHYRYFTVSSQLTNFADTPLEYDFNPKTGKWSLVFYENGKAAYYEGDINTDRITRVGEGKKDKNQSNFTGGEYLSIESIEEPGEVDIDNYRFEDDKDEVAYEKETVTITNKPATAAVDTTKKEFLLPKPRNYRLNFATDYVVSQIDNTFNNRFYQPYTSPTSMFPGISGLIKIGISDLFEDYKVVGGFRLSGSLQNNDYGVYFEDLSGRIDRRYQFQRQATRRIVDQVSIIQVHTHTFEYQFKYPFHELLSMRASLIYRQDRSVFLSTDPTNLSRANRFNHNVGARLEYVFDNTLSKGLNLYNGTRYKFWGEYYVDPLNRQSDLSVVGMDIRHYQRIHRNMILALRMSASTSLGAKRLVYYLGGVDNWLFQRVNNDTPIATDQNYAFQTLAAPMRGFWVNSRNGNSFALLNAELRWPIFKYLLNKPIKSDFVENFQIVGFSDVGSAWTGLTPYSDDNRFNQVIVEQNPITVTINSNREPIVSSYGFGLRSRLLGYFVRADWAWGIDDGLIQPRVFHLSLAMDF